MCSVSIRMHSDDGENYSYQGSLRLKNGRYFVLYEENGVQTVLRIEEHRMAVLRDDAHGGHMVYDPGRNQIVDYQTADGTIRFLLRTQHYERSVIQDQLSVQVRYALYLMSGDLFEPEGCPDAVRALTVEIRWVSD